MLEFAFHAQIAEAADLNQQEREQRQAERDVHIRGNRSQSKQSQRASKQDIDKNRAHIRREGFCLVSKVLLRVIVDFADDQLRGNLSFGCRNRFKTMSHPNTKRRENGGKNEAPENALAQKNASVSEGNDNTRAQLVYMNHISSLPSVFRF